MSPAAAQIGLLFGPDRVHRHSISPQKDRRALLQYCQSSRPASTREWPGSRLRTYGRLLRRPSGAEGALDNRLVPNPVASIAGVAYWQKCLRSGSALPARANVAIDRPDADRTDALAAHDLGRSFRGLSLLNSGLIPQVPFPQFLFTSLGYDQYRPVRRLLSFRIYLQGVSLFLLL